jgi:hypothetical protein
MTSIPQPQRALLLQYLAYSLICGGIFSAAWPSLRSAMTDEAETTTPKPHVLSAVNVGLSVDLPQQNLEGKPALECGLKLLRVGFEQLQRTSDYTGTFHKQERVDGILDEGSVIEVKSRHQPLSFYLKWRKGDRGRELIFVEGENDGEMLVRLGGIRGRMLPVLKIDPNGETAREKTRHDISHMSLLTITNRVIEYREEDLSRTDGIMCRLIANGAESGHDQNRPIRVIVEYERPGISGEYRKTINDIDRQTLLPLTIKTYGWPEPGQDIPDEDLDQETLLEFYEYSELRFDQNLTDEDFSTANSEYSFQRRR